MNELVSVPNRWLEPIKVVLPRETFEFACLVRIRRQSDAVYAEPQREHCNGGTILDGVYNNILGAPGEAAVAMHLNVFWDGNPQRFKAPDVGKYQVRTNGKEWGDLILRRNDKDKPEDLFVLVIATYMPEFWLMGWLRGEEGMRPEYWRSGSPRRPGEAMAWYVPQTKLHPMCDLYEYHHQGVGHCP